MAYPCNKRASGKIKTSNPSAIDFSAFRYIAYIISHIISNLMQHFKIYQDSIVKDRHYKYLLNSTCVKFLNMQFIV